MTTTSPLSLGTLTNVGGTPRLVGVGSKLDTEALIGAMVDAKRLPALRLETRIDANDAKLAALAELRGLLGQLQTASAGLRNPPGSLGFMDNVFETKTAFFSSSTATAPGELMGVTVGANAPTGRFEVAIEHIAAARKFATDGVENAGARLADMLNGGAAFSGSFTIGLEGSGSMAEIEVHGDMTLQDLRAAIGAASGQAGVTASVLKVADGEHRLVLTASQTGREVLLAAGPGDDVLALLGLSEDGGASFANGLQEARLASFSIDGVAMTRTSNSVADAIEGVTLSLFRGEPGTTVTVEIERSLGDIKMQIAGFVEAYNAFRDFVDRQRTVDDSGRRGEGAALFGNSLLRGIGSALGGQVGGVVDRLGADAIATLRGIGITLDANNRLVIDEAQLDQRLLGDLDAVRRVFEFSFESSSADLRVMSRTNALAATAFTVNIVDADEDGVIDSADIDGIEVDIVGSTIRGRAGTPFEALVLAWAGKGSTSIEVTATQGIADKVFNHLGGVLDEMKGTLQTETQSLVRMNDDARRQIERIEERAEDYRLRLIERFAALEAALSLAEAMMQQLRVQTDAMFNKSN